MSKINRALLDSKSLAWYTLSIDNNEVHMNLDSIEYACNVCEKNQYIDMSLVPPGNINITCRSCDNLIYNIDEGDFKILMIPIDEAHDYSVFPMYIP